MKIKDHVGRHDTSLHVEVCETFLSIQGESTRAGMTCFFIRLSGCNLDCEYCDTPQARATGDVVEISRLVSDCVASGAAISEITGGEPLLQSGCTALSRQLWAQTGKPVLVETNGSCDISALPAEVTAIMDIKTPGSGMSNSFDQSNIGKLRAHDEVKFVLANRADYEWACGFLASHRLPDLCRAVLFGAARGMLDPHELAEWMVKDNVPARIQVQLHKILGLR